MTLQVCNKYLYIKLQHPEQNTESTHISMYTFLQMTYFSDKHFEKEVRECKDIFVFLTFAVFITLLES